MLKLVRFLFGLRKPQIQCEQALKIAEEFFQQQDILVHAPMLVEELRTWLIWANGDIMPSPWVRIENQRGNVVDSGRPLR